MKKATGSSSRIGWVKCKVELSMSCPGYGAITAEDVLNFRRLMQEKRQTSSAAEALERLEESGVITKTRKSSLKTPPSRRAAKGGK